MYAATVSEVDGVRLLDPAAVERMTVVQTDRTRMLGLPPGLTIPADRSFCMSLGFWRSCPPMPWVGPGSFGHPGSGGSVGFADPDARVGFGYVTNLWSWNTAAPRAASLAAAVRACLGQKSGSQKFVRVPPSGWHPRFTELAWVPSRGYWMTSVTVVL